MAGVTMSTLNNMLKDIYLPALRQRQAYMYTLGDWWGDTTDRRHALIIKEELEEGLYDPLLTTIAKMVLADYEEEHGVVQLHGMNVKVSPLVPPGRIYLLDKSYLDGYPAT